jgi:hypothetical protein
MKKCSKCGELKPLESFRFRNKTLNKRHSKCNVCYSEYQKYRWDNNINGARDKGRNASRKYNYEQRYNAPGEVIDRLMKDKNGNCEICGTEKELFVDHCHNSDKYRGLLCRSCNLMLGYARDNMDTLIAGANYLKCRN